MKHSLEPTGERPDTTDTDVIMLSQDFERLKSEVEKLRTELSMLVLERDELLLVECKNIGSRSNAVCSCRSVIAGGNDGAVKGL